ncbi:oxidoreductase, 2OG-Fe(II) oxygenase family, partial [mine drainage metagenome]
MLLQIPNMLTAAQVAALRVRLETADAPWVDGRATAGHTGAPVKFNQQIDERAAMARELGDVVLAALERNPLFISAALPQRVYPPLFNRYGVGMSFGAHVDGSVRLLPGSGQKIRTDLSATLFLSAPEDYDNGELQIEDTCGLQRIRLAAGDMVLYPASSLHRVTEVTRGTRMALFFSGYRAWCATTGGAPCCSTWTAPSSAC